MGLSTFLYLSRNDVEKINLPVIEIIEAVETVFKEKGACRTEMPPKPGIHTRENAFIHAMPAYVPAFEAAGMKWVSGYPENPAKGLPYISGLVVLNDPETGLPLAVMDCTWITGKRTAAATAVAAKYLARKDSSRVGIVACGVQGRTNLEALCALFPVSHVKAYDLYPEIAERYVQDMSSRFAVSVEPVTCVKDAVENMDIIVTSGPILQNPRPAIEKDWLSPGSFACPLDFDSYWQGEAMKQVDKLATDDINQLNYYRTVGYFKDTPEPYADLGEIAAGKYPGRELDDERTMSINLGLALEDVTAAVKIYTRACQEGIGIELPL